MMTLIIAGLGVLTAGCSTTSTDDPVSGKSADAPAVKQVNQRACDIVRGQTVATFDQSNLLQLQGVLGDSISLEQNSLIAANLDWTTKKATNGAYDKAKAGGQLKDLENSLCNP